MSYVYILISDKNHRFYIGSTNNLRRRLSEHQLGKSKYTSNVLPIQLLFSQKFKTLNEARKIENWLKKQKSALLIKKIIKQGIILKSIN